MDHKDSNAPESNGEPIEDTKAAGGEIPAEQADDTAAADADVQIDNTSEASETPQEDSASTEDPSTETDFSEKKSRTDRYTTIPGTRGKARRKLPRWAIILICIGGVLLLVLGLSAGYILNRLNRIRLPDDIPTPMPTLEPTATPTLAPEATEPPNIDVEGVMDVATLDGTINVMLLGVDTRDKDAFFGSRTDSMVLATLDPVNNTVKFTSFMRDIYVDMGGYGQDRLNTAFRYGNYDLLRDTLKKHFGVDVEYFVVVNFWSMADIIDLIGGIEVELSAEELPSMKDSIWATAWEYGRDPDEVLIHEPGIYTLNGIQAVSYSRVRLKSSGDYERTNRQRLVLMEIVDSLGDLSLLELLQLIDKAPNFVRTNLPIDVMTRAAGSFVSMKNYTIYELRIPLDDGHYQDMVDGRSVLRLDFRKNSAALQDFLQDPNPTPVPTTR